jgi:acyl-CoA synthetase (AMP-forming)/AMP-acid ligase II
MRRLFTACVFAALLAGAGLVEAKTAVTAEKLELPRNAVIRLPVLADDDYPKAAALVAEIVRQTVLEAFQGYSLVLADLTEELDNSGNPGEERCSFFCDYEVKYNENGLFSIAVDMYSYTGGAHGLTQRFSVTADLAASRVLTLPDLFKEGAGYQKLLNARIREAINRRPDWGDSVTFSGVTGNDGFYLTPEGLVIYYQAYEIAPYALGLPSFIIDKYELADMWSEGLRNRL